MMIIILSNQSVANGLVCCDCDTDSCDTNRNIPSVILDLMVDVSSRFRLRLHSLHLAVVDYYAQSIFEIVRNRALVMNHVLVLMLL